MLQKIKNIFHLVEGLASTTFFRSPGKKMTVIGVTGTDGKTTTTSLIHHLLTKSGIKTGIMSTLGSLHMTTPGRGRVQKFLSQSLKNGCTHAVLEVTSIAVDQHRIWGVPFRVGVLTNIAQNEHLDYHKSFAKYQEAKIKFLKSCPVVVANADDQSFETLKTALPKKTILISYAVKNAADLKPKDIEYSASGTKFSLGDIKFKSQLLGEFNVYNSLAAIATVQSLGINMEDISRGLKDFSPPSGRLEVVTRQPFTVIVDFAHTPQAFESVLPVAKSMVGKKAHLIHVFGATGNRDRAKRPVMAKIAAQFDDYIILTHEDTYTEDPKRIIAELEGGLKEVGYTDYQVSFDRKEAIEVALKMAKRGDVVILTGVGHQKTMNLGGKEIPWSDQKVVKELLKQ